MYRNKMFSILFFSIILFLAGCELDVPINEMSRAHSLITRADEVSAKKYADESYSKSVALLIQAQKDISEEKTDEAKSNAEKSSELAQKAIDDSLPLLSTDSLELAKSALTKAENLNSDSYAAEQYNNAKSLYSSAEKQNNEKNFWESHLSSLAAISAAESAADKSRARIPELIEKLRKIETDVKTLSQQKVDNPEYTNLVSKAAELLKDADSQITSGDLKKALESIVNAEKTVQQADLIARLETQQKRINSASVRLEEQKARPESKHASDLLEKAADYLNNAKSHIEASDPKKASVETESAEKLIDQSTLSMQKGSAEERLESLESKIASVSANAPDGQFIDEINSINSHLAASRSSITDSNFTNASGSMDKADAEISRLESSISEYAAARQREAEEAKKAAKAESPREPEIEPVYYVVQYNPKDRDCLWKIAGKHYKNPALWPLIYIANKNQIKDPDLIFPGQKFLIPPEKKDEEILNEAESSTEATVDKQ